MRGSSSSTRCSCGAFLLVLAAASSSFVVDSVQAQLDQVGQDGPAVTHRRARSIPVETRSSCVSSPNRAYAGRTRVQWEHRPATRLPCLPCTSTGACREDGQKTKLAPGPADSKYKMWRLTHYYPTTR